MNANENNHTNEFESIIELGVASVETHGPRPGFEPVGSITPTGISEE